MDGQFATVWVIGVILSWLGVYDLHETAYMYTGDVLMHHKEVAVYSDQA
jgi:hypothetical protein